MNVSQILARIRDILLPPRATEELIHTLQLDDLLAITLQGEKRGSLPYHDPRVRALVWELKYFSHPKAVALAGAILSKILLEIRSKTKERPLLIPIPMHPSRRRMRGHNQTEVLCEAALAYMPNLFEYTPHALVRTRTTPQQQGLSKDERLQNLKHSMAVTHTTHLHGRRCVVIDDVSTTGATFAEASRALAHAGAGHIRCVALAYPS